MNKIILIILFFASTNILFGQKANKQTIVIKTQIFCDHCLQCESCGANIKDNINANKGIEKVLIDSNKNLIIVTYDASIIRPEKIREAINKAGYDADDQKATAQAIKALDGCCKKD